MMFCPSPKHGSSAALFQLDCSKTDQLQNVGSSALMHAKTDKAKFKETSWTIYKQNAAKSANQTVKNTVLILLNELHEQAAMSYILY